MNVIEFISCDSENGRLQVWNRGRESFWLKYLGFRCFQSVFWKQRSERDVFELCLFLPRIQGIGLGKRLTPMENLRAPVEIDLDLLSLTHLQLQTAPDSSRTKGWAEIAMCNKHHRHLMLSKYSIQPKHGQNTASSESALCSSEVLPPEDYEAEHRILKVSWGNAESCDWMSQNCWDIHQTESYLPSSSKSPRARSSSIGLPASAVCIEHAILCMCRNPAFACMQICNKKTCQEAGQEVMEVSGRIVTLDHVIIWST